jgi:hypothetical protein
MDWTLIASKGVINIVDFLKLDRSHLVRSNFKLVASIYRECGQ